MTQYPLIIVEGTINQLDLFKTKIDPKFSVIDCRPLTGGRILPRTLPIYLDIFAHAMLDTWAQPTIILGWWLSYQLNEALSGDEFKDPLLGRVLERIANRYGVLRVLLPEDHDGHPLINRLTGFGKQDPELLESDRDWHLTYLGHLLAYPLHTTSGWVTAFGPEHLSSIIDCAHTYHERTPEWVFEGSHAWYGSYYPQIMIVGDRYNPPGATYPFPFAKLSHSAHYLNLAVNLAGLEESRLGWVNANDPGGVEHLVRLRYMTLKHSSWRFEPPHLVALGNMAAKTLDSLDLTYTALPHPQFVKRFHHSKLWDYAAQLAQFKEIA